MAYNPSQPPVREAASSPPPLGKSRPKEARLDDQPTSRTLHVAAGSGARCHAQRGAGAECPKKTSLNACRAPGLRARCSKPLPVRTESQAPKGGATGETRSLSVSGGRKGWRGDRKKHCMASLPLASLEPVSPPARDRKHGLRERKNSSHEKGAQRNEEQGVPGATVSKSHLSEEHRLTH